MTGLAADDVEYLRAVKAGGGRNVTTTMIRQETGFSSPKTRYRHQKLEERGYLIGGRAGDSRTAPRTATLTDRARRVLDDLSGDASAETEEEDDEPTVVELQERIDRVETRVDVLMSTRTLPFDEIERELTWLNTVVDALYAHHSLSDETFMEAMEDV